MSVSSLAGEMFYSCLPSSEEKQMTAESQRYPLPFTPVACFFISVEKGRAERNGECESKTTLGSENKNQTNKEKKKENENSF